MVSPEQEEDVCTLCGAALRLEAKDLLGPGGIVKETREPQIQMAEVVDAAIWTKENAVAEAGVGCHAAGQGILMYDGTVKRVEDVQVGDNLVGPDGLPREVLALARGEQEMVDVVPVKGNRWRVNIDHILTIVDTCSDKITDVRVSDFLHWGRKRRAHSKLFRAAAEFATSSRSLPIDPYFLGVILGDGGLSHSSNGVNVTTVDPEILDTLTVESKRWGLWLRPADDITYLFRRTSGHSHWSSKPSPLNHALRDMGLLPIACADRFVPLAYKTGSVHVRLEILAGLVDTDGSRTNNCFDFISKSRRLADDVTFIARSVGLAAYVKPCQKSAYPGHIDTYHRVSISGNTDIIPCRIPRKQASARSQKKDALRTGFTIEQTGNVEPFYGFTLTGDGRYLLDDFTVTHNTGKTFAYLIPAILSKRRTVVATATVGLQSQIINNDLPFLAKALEPYDVRFTYAVAKGKSHYVCGRAVKSLSGDSKSSVDVPGHFYAWAENAMQGVGVGDKAELGDAVPDYWNGVSAENCIGSSCSAWKHCGYAKAKAAIADANVIIANHSLVGLDLALSNQKSKHPLLNGYECLVLDEAHKALDYIRNAFSYEGKRNLPEQVAKTLDRRSLPYDGALLGQFEKAVTSFFACLPVPKPGEGFARVLPSHVATPAYQAALISVATAATAFIAKAKTFADNIDARREFGMPISDTDWTDYYAARRACRRVDEFKDAVAKTVDDANSDNSVVFTRWDNGELELIRSPINIGGILKSVLYDHVKSVVLTSATISIDGGFDAVKEDFGLDVRPEYELKVKSPFDYDQSSVLYLSPTIPPAPKSARDVVALSAYSSAVAAQVASLCKETNGRAFVLFTARTELEAVANQLRPYNLNILKQDGSTTAGALAQRYRDEAAAGKAPVLLGLKSFWEGVSIEGDDLSLVIIAKLPFPPQTDPIYQARCDKAGTEWFRKVALPDMIKDLQQGTGRLIRTTTDVGMVAILDSRMVDPNVRYRQMILRSLPFRKISTDIEKVKAFYRKIRDARDSRVAA